jgi:hypothetical protein
MVDVGLKGGNYSLRIIDRNGQRGLYEGVVLV